MAVSFGRLALKQLPLVAALGFAGLAVTVAMGFEKPNAALLISSALALLAPLIAIGLHLALNRELTAEEKRAWWRGFRGSQAAGAWSSYLGAITSGTRADPPPPPPRTP